MERDVERVGKCEFARKNAVLGDFGQRCPNGEQFAGNSARVENQEERVSTPGQCVRNEVDNVERIVQISSDLGQRPTSSDQKDADAGSTAGERPRHTPDNQNTRNDLFERDDRVGRDKPDNAVQHFEQLQRLKDGQRSFDSIPETTIVELNRLGFQHKLIQTIAPSEWRWWWRGIERCETTVSGGKDEDKKNEKLTYPANWARL